MTNHSTKCLILACGNTLRGDDGVGPWLAAWAEKQFQARGDVRVVARQQWTPDLAADVAFAESVLFVDCALNLEPGSLNLVSIEAASRADGLPTHHIGAAELLELGKELYDSLPLRARLLTLGAGSTELGESFSAAVSTRLPAACDLLKETVLQLMGE